MHSTPSPRLWLLLGREMVFHFILAQLFTLQRVLFPSLPGLESMMILSYETRAAFHGGNMTPPKSLYRVLWNVILRRNPPTCLQVE